MQVNSLFKRKQKQKQFIGKRLKTENMKTRMKQLTACTLLALLMVVGNVRAEGTEVKASSLEALTETKLELENWMMDENIWNGRAYAWIEEATEESLPLENWMTDENIWSEPANVWMKNASEMSLGIENWMTNENTWKSESSLNVENEAKLKLEGWMTADNVWNR